MLNQLTLQGFITSEIEMHKGKKSVMANFYLLSKKTVGDGYTDVLMKCTLFGKHAMRLKEFGHKGLSIIVWGLIECTRKQAGSFDYWLSGRGWCFVNPMKAQEEALVDDEHVAELEEFKPKV